jgi:hypothetical protein
MAISALDAEAELLHRSRRLLLQKLKTLEQEEAVLRTHLDGTTPRQPGGEWPASAEEPAASGLVWRPLSREGRRGSSISGDSLDDDDDDSDDDGQRLQQFVQAESDRLRQSSSAIATVVTTAAVSDSSEVAADGALLRSQQLRDEQEHLLAQLGGDASPWVSAEVTPLWSTAAAATRASTSTDRRHAPT